MAEPSAPSPQLAVVAMTGPKIGLAISGGGFRATAFGLGCLRALRDRDLLGSLRAVSGVSGGALLAALYGYGPEEFETFDAMVVDLLRSGIQLEALVHALRPDRILWRGVDGSLALLDRRPRREPRLRRHTRTDSMTATFARRAFHGKLMEDPTHPQSEIVLSATDLRTSNAVRFGSRLSACSAYGVIEGHVTVAEAVAASAAYPLLLPAVERRYNFRPAHGGPGTSRSVLLSDGGIYDNLASSVLEPGRSSAHTSQVFALDYILLADAGRGALKLTEDHFLASRMQRSFNTTYRRAQDGSKSVLYGAVEAGRLQGLVHAYLGMDDGKLPAPIPGLVPRDAVSDYGTNFRSMSLENVKALTGRGEQLMRALIEFYCPDL